MKQELFSAFNYPKLSEEWHPTKNGELTPMNITYREEGMKVWWLCGQGHEWKDSPKNRRKGKDCPNCSESIVLQGKFV